MSDSQGCKLPLTEMSPQLIKKPNQRNCCRKGDPFQGPKLGSCLTLGNELSVETCVLTKWKILLGEGARVESPRVKGTQQNCCATWLTVLGFMVMGLVSGLSLANLQTQSPSWCCTSCSAEMDTSERGSGRWLDMRCLLSTFLELFRLVGAY